jgi:Sodium / potassium ATPase beta chain
MNPPKDHKENAEKECSHEKLPTGGKVCPVDVSDKTFKGCTNSNDYGYSESAPCIFLKLNKVSGTMTCFVANF